MAWLNAALAFAITFLILSMVASVFVETLHRFLGMRERGLKLLVGQYYDRVLGPYLSSRGCRPDDMKKAFLDLMTLNRAPAGAVGKTNVGENETWRVSMDDTTEFDTGLFSRVWSGRRLANLDSSQFMSRLGDTEVGLIVHEAVSNAGTADPEAPLHDLAAKFDAFAAEASLFFERRARLTSVLVAIAVAWMMYVHPFDIFKAYMADPQVAARVIEMQAAAIAKHEAALEKAQKITEPAGEAGNAEQETPTFSPAVKEAQDALTDLRDAGVPIGWTAARYKAAGFEESWIGVPYPIGSNGWRNAFWLLLGGLLVGLGGPFWYDMVKSLSNIRTLVGGAKAVVDDVGGVDLAMKVTQPAVDQFKQSVSAKMSKEHAADADDELPVG